MEQSYIFDFCSLFDMEQDKDIKSYIQQQRNNNNKVHQSTLII